MPPLFEVDFAAFRAEGFRHVRHADFNGLRGGVIAYFPADFHRAEFWSAHGAEVRNFARFLRQGFIVIGAGGKRIQRR